MSRDIPNGFPEEIIKPFIKKIGTDILGDYSASGTERGLGRE